ncbi:MAG TPA: SDR family oxidoreductase [Ignavibacteria bacterium]|nr:SDR family oxidoreductase [Ignavibacteria bacterium]
MNDRWTLNNKKALITGATRGIGRAVVDEFLKLGAEVFIVSRNQKDVEELIRLKTDEGYKVSGIKCDVADKNERERLVSRIAELWGTVDVLVNNAGTNTRKKTLENTEEHFDNLIGMNMKSVFELCRLFHPLLKKSGDASIINIVSVGGITSVGTGSPYAISKAGIIHFTKYLAVEWAGDSIRVNAVAPWYIRTSLTEPVLKKPEYLKAVLDRTPMNRIGEPDEVAAAAAFLSMPAASYITGECLSVDGGFLKYGFSI